MTDLPKKSWYRIQEVAYYFGVDDSTIRRWIDHAKLEAAKIGGSIMIKRDWLENFEKSAKIDPFK